MRLPLLIISLCAASYLFAADRPNILFCISDDQSFPHASAYGTQWVKTPAFDRVAEQGLLFMNAYTPNPKCAPSRAIVLTGRNSWQLEEAANHISHFPEKFTTYPEALGQNGYFTGYTGKGWAPGDPGEVDGEPRELTGRRYDKRSATPPTSQMSKNDYAANFADFLDDRPDDQPFCFWYGSTEPHRRYEYGSGVAAGKQLDDIERVPDYWPDDERVRHDMLDYALEIEYFDAHLGRMIEELQTRGLLENTLIVVTSDNGMPFPRVKGNNYESSAHMPLALMWPKGVRRPGRAIDDFVSFADFAATFLDVAGINEKEAGIQPITGNSLVPIMRSKKAGQVDPERVSVLLGKERHDAGRPNNWGYPVRGIIRDGFLYLRNFKPDRWPSGNPETGYLNTDGSPTKTLILDSRLRSDWSHYWQSNFGARPPEELYDLVADPDCVDNLAADPAFEDRKRQLAAEMLSDLALQGDPRMFGHGEIFDRYPFAREAMQDFYEKFMETGDKSPTAGWVEESDFEEAPLPLRP